MFIAVGFQLVDFGLPNDCANTPLFFRLVHQQRLPQLLLLKASFFLWILLLLLPKLIVISSNRGQFRTQQNDLWQADITG